MSIANKLVRPGYCEMVLLQRVPNAKTRAKVTAVTKISQGCNRHVTFGNGLVRRHLVSWHGESTPVLKNQAQSDGLRLEVVKRGSPHGEAEQQVVFEILGQVDIFRGIPLDGLARLAEQGQLQRFPAGTSLMRQGETSDALYVIIEGRVIVERAHPALQEPIRLAELGPGETVGEMGVLDQQTRSATVTALEDTAAIRLSVVEAMDIIARYPEVAAAMLRTLSQRLRRTSDLLG